MRRQRSRGAQSDPSGPCLERPQFGITVRCPLRKNGDRAAADQHGASGLECLGVLSQVGSGVLAPIHRDRFDRARDGADNRHAEQRRLREERHAPRCETEKKCRINQPVRMVEHEDDGTFGRNSLDSRDLDAPEEDPQHQPQEGTQQRSHATAAVGTRDSRHAAYVQIRPPRSTAIGIIRTAWPSDPASDIRPTSEGDGTSPSTWITKMLSATAVARMCGETTLTIAELMGPVDAKRHSSAATMAGQYTLGCRAARATSVSGAASSVTTPDIQRYACRDTRSRRSPSQPPPYVPTNPVTTTTAPNWTVACALGMPRARSRNEGVQKASAPMAKV